MTPSPPRARSAVESAVEARALTAGMTLREKVGQLNQRLLGWQCVERVGGRWRTTPTLHEEVERWGGLGALYGLFRADAWSGRDWNNGVRPEERAEVAEMVVAEVRSASRHGIGPLLVEEAPHGHQALGAGLLPVNLAVGATWDEGLYAEAAAAVASGLRADGVHLALVSALDLLRDPRWGRAEECYGEVPALAAAMTSAVVTGMQGGGRSRLLDGSGVGIVLKHFAAQGEGVGGRNGHSAQIGSRDLQELHLPAALAGVAAGAVGIMAAYNDIDGVPCVANAPLLTGLLRDGWGFDGIVMADGLAVDRIVEQVGSPLSAAATALRSGVDLSLWDRSFARLEEAVALRPDLERVVDRACERVLAVKGQLGLLPGAPRPAPAAERARETAVLSQWIATRSVVLLPGTGEDRAREALPVRGPGEWVVTGPRAHDVEAMLGDYVPPLAEEERVSIAAALVAESLGSEASFAAVDADDVSALAAATGVVVVLGGSSHRPYGAAFADNGASAGQTAADCGEGVDLSSPTLPDGQVEMLSRVRRAAGGPVVAVVLAGRPYVLSEVARLADVILLAFYPGPHGGRAVADLVLGRTQPVGRLPVTMPSAPGAIPVRADERLGAGDVYRDVAEPVLWPVGAGGGYGRVDGVQVTALRRADVVVVELEGHVAEGEWPAEELAHVRALRRGGHAWPRAELVAWRRIRAAQGTRFREHLEIPLRDVFLPPAELAPLARATTDLVVTLGSARVTLTLADEA
ncbi:beta-glucosidase [Promicromonospora sp. AC04]|nr:beta-glucosidase [Promicromonospora sp. AC04]